VGCRKVPHDYLHFLVGYRSTDKGNNGHEQVPHEHGRYDRTVLKPSSKNIFMLKMKMLSDVTCPFCGTLCDDIEVVVVQNMIEEVRHACKIGTAKF
jgi:hypothetical protein